ncbi:MAG: transcriptional regulator [Deltaproteobacteria bacterium CG11_big_fil_rev_8_21_14_0_20_45_16]|nr:MAG: transcriptional regulator [Deltaproteobacteria bacterium CG11_big_fil_rev_8_21_14_0_20_45_16]
MRSEKDRVLNSVLAQTVRRLRNKRSHSQEELALLASVDRTYISGIERARRNITVATLERLIPHLSTSPVEFFQELCKDLESPSNNSGDRPHAVQNAAQMLSAVR